MNNTDTQSDYARLGQLTFRVQGGINGFSETAAYEVVEHTVVLGKNPLQGMGEKLRQIKIELDLQGFLTQIDPEQVLNQLSQILASGTAKRLFFGNGRYAGNYLLTQMETVVRRTNANGSIAEANVTLSLLEAVDRQIVTYSVVEKKPPAQRRPKARPHPVPFAPKDNKNTTFELVRTRDYLKLPPEKQATSIQLIN